MREEQMNEKNKKRVLIWLFVFFILTVGCIVFGVLCIYAAKNAFFIKHAWWLTIVASVLFSALCGFSVWFVLAKKEILYKAALSIYIFLLFCLVLCFILQKTGFFHVIKDADSLQAYLQTAGRWMPAMYIALQYLQVVILPIPSIVSTVAGVALFGAFQTTIYSLIGILFGSLTAFFIGRKLGHKAVVWLVGEDSLIKWQKKLKGKDNLVLTLMFILVMIFIARVLAVSATCYSFDFIPFNTWWGLLIWGVIIASIVTAFILIYKNLDKIQSRLSKRFKIFRKKNK